MSEINSEITNDIERYFVQQAQLYGADFYFSNKAIDFETMSSSSNVKKIEILTQVAAQCHACVSCGLARKRKQVVFGSGNEKANLMCVFGNPGSEEDQSGYFGVGAQGSLVSKILKAIEFESNEIYQTSVVKCAPPNNRDSHVDERVKCMPYLLQQIDMIKPRFLLVFGEIAAQTILKSEKTLSQLRGSAHSIHNGIYVIVTHHPGVLLRNNDLKRETWADVQTLRSLYDEKIGDKGKFKHHK